MQSTLVDDLRAKRPAIYSRWKEVLSLDPETSPLGDPEILVYMIDLTLDELFRDLGGSDGATGRAHAAAAACACGRNPYTNYFAAGRKAVREALILAQANLAPLLPADRDAAFRDLDEAYGRIERSHVDLFCSVCQHKPGTGFEHTSQHETHR